MVLRVQATGYMVSSLGYRVDGFKGTGYLVMSMGIRFGGYRGAGYVVSHHPWLDITYSIY